MRQNEYGVPSVPTQPRVPAQPQSWMLQHAHAQGAQHVQMLMPVLQRAQAPVPVPQHGPEPKLREAEEPQQPPPRAAIRHREHPRPSGGRLGMAAGVAS